MSSGRRLRPFRIPASNSNWRIRTSDKLPINPPSEFILLQHSKRFDTVKKLLGALILCLIATQMRAALDPPSMRCVEVLDTGDVTISWFPPIGNPAEFVEYQIFESPNPTGPFFLLASVNNFATTFYTHVGALVNSSNTHYYYVETVFNDGTQQNSSPSDTLEPMRAFLTLWQQDYSGQVIWNPVHNPKIPSNGDYTLERRIGSGTWGPIANMTFGNELFNDSISRCDDTVRYRIRVQDQTTCFSVSSVAEEHLIDNTPPEAPVIDSISIDNTAGTIGVAWTPSSSPDVVAYTITRLSPTTPLDTVQGRLNTYWVDMSDPLDYFSQSLGYEIAAVDSCGNITPGIRKHETINLSATRDLCSRTINLSWSAYRGWNVVNSYTILVSVEGGPYELLGTTGANERTFAHTGIDATKIYCYTVRANGAGVQLSTSTSDLVCVTFPNIVAPSFQYLNRVSVLEDNKVYVSCYVDTTLDMGVVEYYRIMRGFSVDGPFETLDTFAYDTTRYQIEYVDSNVFPDMYEYSYVIEAIDDCEKPLVRSNVGRTIHLSLNSDKYNFLNDIQWTGYTDWTEYGQGVRRYDLYRGINGEFDSIPFFSGPEHVYLTEDDLGDFQQQGSRICYYVEAVERNGNLFGLLDTSRSNVACSTFESDLYIPDAFSPNQDGRNEYFKPITPYVNPANYECVIYDRWGQHVYTIDQNNFRGWSGADASGKPHPVGVYVYHLRLTTERGSVVDRKGSFNLIR
jgi:gliding motility-associated-like protein